MAKSPSELGRRERQIVEAVYRLGEASVADVRAQLSDPPSYSAVRTMLVLLVGKGMLRFRQEGKRYLYRPAVSRKHASRSALSHLVATFFGGKPTDVVATLLDLSADKLSDEDFENLKHLIEQARKENR